MSDCESGVPEPAFRHRANKQTSMQIKKWAKPSHYPSPLGDGLVFDQGGIFVSTKLEGWL